MSQVNSTSIINDDNTLFDIQLNMEMSMRTEGIEKMKRSISKNQQTRGESGTEYGPIRLEIQPFSDPRRNFCVQLRC